MTTLKNIADLILHDAGGDKSKDSNLDERDIIKKARLCCNAVLKPVYYANKDAAYNGPITNAIYSYERSLEADSVSKFITIPDVYMALPYSEGINRLYVKGNPYHDFVIQHRPGISGNLPHTKLKGIQYCYIEGMKVVMGRGCTAKKADKLILQIINVAPDSVGPNDPLPMMPEQLTEVLRILRAEFFPTLAIPADKVNNENPNIR